MFPLLRFQRSNLIKSLLLLYEDFIVIVLTPWIASNVRYNTGTCSFQASFLEVFLKNILNHKHSISVFSTLSLKKSPLLIIHLSSSHAKLNLPEKTCNK